MSQKKMSTASKQSTVREKSQPAYLNNINVDLFSPENAMGSIGSDDQSSQDNISNNRSSSYLPVIPEKGGDVSRILVREDLGKGRDSMSKQTKSMHRLGGEHALAQLNSHHSGEIHLGQRGDGTEKIKSLVKQSPYSVYQSVGNIAGGTVPGSAARQASPGGNLSMSVDKRL